MSETVLVVGETGRDMALAEAVAMSEEVGRVFCIPGNAGTAQLSKIKNVNFWHLDVEGITRFACEHREGLSVVIGPRGPQVRGLGDSLREQNIPVLGSSSAAAQLEKSKIFADGFMKQYGIPHPKSEVATSLSEALSLLSSNPLSQVIKADGTAYGKGVVLPSTSEEAKWILQAMFGGEAFNGAGKDGVVLQERLSGPERSVFVICGNENFSIVPFIAQDYKRLQENDVGPNTGGMGAYAQDATEMMNRNQLEEVYDIASKTISGMIDRGTPFQGVLYLGLMLAKEYDNRPVVLEYNTRFGDPEAQVVLPLMVSAGFDMHSVFREASIGRVPDLPVPRIVGDTALTVCLMAQGYPDNPRAGATIHGLDRLYPDVKIYHNSTVRNEGNIQVAGGRVLDVTGMGTDVDAAAQAAYRAIGENGVHFDGVRYRTDIGFRV
jgi:phosphoribosylamine--glycine ligase